MEVAVNYEVSVDARNYLIRETNHNIHDNMKFQENDKLSLSLSTYTYCTSVFVQKLMNWQASNGLTKALKNTPTQETHIQLRERKISALKKGITTRYWIECELSISIWYSMTES